MHGLVRLGLGVPSNRGPSKAPFQFSQLESIAGSFCILHVGLLADVMCVHIYIYIHIFVFIYKLIPYI